MITMVKTWLHRKSIYRQTYNELAALSDRDLHDLGITRDSISTLAKVSTYGETHK